MQEDDGADELLRMVEASRHEEWQVAGDRKKPLRPTTQVWEATTPFFFFLSFDIATWHACVPALVPCVRAVHACPAYVPSPPPARPPARPRACVPACLLAAV